MSEIRRPTRRDPSRRLVLAAGLVAPATVFLSASVLQYGFGIEGAADWLDPLFNHGVIGWLVTAIILAGPAVALVLAATLLLPLRLVRDGDAWEVRIRVRPDRWAIVIAGLSLVVGGFLVAHVIAENLACAIGISSGC